MLEVRQVTKNFGGLQALDGVSLHVPEGKIIGLIGPNGSGKSTLMNVIAGTLKPSSGQIIFDGTDITSLSADAIFQRGLARGYQDPALFFQMTVLDNALLPVKQQRGEHPWYAPWRWLWRGEERQHARAASEVLARLQLRGHYDRPAAD
ncbi:MAG: ATP-binding cassette domain-containing protein, partial [Anaerolineae bacterium]|nr:ATP-binding cassette domain-containing protein [Anaerolineae bacterium]